MCHVGLFLDFFLSGPHNYMMPRVYHHQLFKTQVPLAALWTLLDALCVRTDAYYVLDATAYRKGMHVDMIPAFVQSIRPHYHLSKQKYLDRATTAYVAFMTVVRQICKSYQVAYDSQIHYNHAGYSIVYRIYVPKDELSAPRI